MSSELRQRVPDPDILLGLEPEELARVMLPILKARERSGKRLSGYNFCNELRQLQEIYPRQYVGRISQAIMEAWTWMLSNHYLAIQKKGSGRPLL